MRRRARKTKMPAIDAHSDPILMRHIRLLKPELARTGFRTARWGDVAAATNLELGVKKYKTGQSAQRRFGILRSAYEDEEQRAHLPDKLTRRMDEYFAMVEVRQASEAKAAEASARHDEQTEDDQEQDEDEHEDARGQSYEPEEEEGEQEEEDEDDGVEEVRFKREVRVDTAVDVTGGRASHFTAPPAFNFALPRSREALLYDQVQAQQKVLQSLLDMMNNDREAHRQEFREIVRLVTRK